MINVEFDLNELDDVCKCMEYCLRDDKIKPSEREQVRKLAERLRNMYEVGKDMERESAN